MRFIVGAISVCVSALAAMVFALIAFHGEGNTSADGAVTMMFSAYMAFTAFVMIDWTFNDQ